MIKKVIFGNEPYLIEKAVADITSGRNVVKYDLAVTPVTDVNLALTQVSFFGADELYVVTAKTLEQANGILFCESHYDLLILPEAVDKRKSIYKALSKESNVLTECNMLSGKKLKDAVFQMAEGRITDAAYELIISRTRYGQPEGDSLLAISKYIGQMILLDGTVTESRVPEIVPEAAKSAFVLSSALIKGDADTLFNAGQQLVKNGESEIALLSLMQRPFRLAYLSQYGDVGQPEWAYRDALVLGHEKCGKVLDIIEDATDRFKSGAKNGLFILALGKCYNLLHT